MKYVLRVLAMLSVAALCGSAMADPIFYNIAGTLQAGGSASGTIRVYNGQILDVNVTVTGLANTYQFGSPVTIAHDPGLVQLFQDSKPNSSPDYLTLAFPQSSLTDYAGGPLCSLSFTCAGANTTSQLELQFGYPDDPSFHTEYYKFEALNASPVPEPGTLTLVGSGILLLTQGYRARRSRPQA